MEKIFKYKHVKQKEQMFSERTQRPSTNETVLPDNGGAKKQLKHAFSGHSSVV